MSLAYTSTVLPRGENDDVIVEPPNKGHFGSGGGGGLSFIHRLSCGGRFASYTLHSTIEISISAIV